MKTQVTLVRNSSIVYPHTDKDFEYLAGLGVPIRKIDLSYLPTLRAYANQCVFVMHDIEALETQMIKKLRVHWPHEVELTSNNLTLLYPRETSERLVEKAVSSLKRWYRGHFIQLEQVTKRGGKQYKTVLTKKVVD